MATCKGCGKEIDWVKTSRGKNMPLDANRKGTVAVKTEEGWKVYKDARVPHWTTCPNAEDFRRKKADDPKPA